MNMKQNNRSYCKDCYKIKNREASRRANQKQRDKEAREDFYDWFGTGYAIYF